MNTIILNKSFMMKTEYGPICLGVYYVKSLIHFSTTLLIPRRCLLLNVPFYWQHSHRQSPKIHYMKIKSIFVITGPLYTLIL